MWRELNESEYQYLIKNAEKNKMIIGLFISIAQLLCTIVLIILLADSMKTGASVIVPGVPVLALAVIGLQVLRTRVFVVKKMEDYEAFDTKVGSVAEYVNHASTSYGSREAVNYKVSVGSEEITISVNGTAAGFSEGEAVTVVREKGKKRVSFGYKLIPSIK